MGEPEDTAPFTHQPYGRGGEDNPFVSPSGPAAQPSGPELVLPAALPPPTVGPVPYGPPAPGPGQATGQGFGQGWVPAYGMPYAGSLNHKGANTSMVLGVISIVSLLAGFACCFVTLPGLLCAPFAWWTGASAKREIERQPGVYGNLGAAQAGMWMGIVMTVIGALVLAGVVAVVAWVGLTDFSLV